MSEFKGELNPILEIAENTLSKYPYEKERHPVFGAVWYRRGGLFKISGDERQFFGADYSSRKGFRNKRYIPFDVSACIAEPEFGGWLTKEFRYFPKSNYLSVTHSMAPRGETFEELQERQKQLRVESFSDPNCAASIHERQKFIELLRLIGEKGILLSQQN